MEAVGHSIFCEPENTRGIYIYIYIYIFTLTYRHTCSPTLLTSMCVYMFFVHMYIHTHIQECSTKLLTCMCLCVGAFVKLYLCLFFWEINQHLTVSVYIHIFIFTHTYVHTCMHAYRSAARRPWDVGESSCRALHHVCVYVCMYMHLYCTSNNNVCHLWWLVYQLESYILWMCQCAYTTKPRDPYSAIRISQSHYIGCLGKHTIESRIESLVFQETSYWLARESNPWHIAFCRAIRIAWLSGRSTLIECPFSRSHSLQLHSQKA